MKTEQFLGHHGIRGNPFSDEDAQTDVVFKEGCLWKIHHPAWGKFYGDPKEPSTAIVFGEKGSGKTALRLQAAAELQAYDQKNPDSRVFVIEYDDFNPYLDRLLIALKTRDPSEVLGRFQLKDHMDAILALGMTRLGDEIVARRHDLSLLSPDQKRDLLMLAAFYDQSKGQPVEQRWHRMRRCARFRGLLTRRDLLIGSGVTFLVVMLVILNPALLLGASTIPWLLLSLLIGWVPWLRRAWNASRLARDIQSGLRVLNRDLSPLRWKLLWFDAEELAGQPLPTASRGGSEERYELLRKFQSVTSSLGYSGIIVLIDRVDEPQLVAGDPRMMRALVWPLLDHKFLRHAGIGFKILLPIELAYYLEKEEKPFYDKARPDKLNLIKPLRWTGPTLYDLASDRLAACALDTKSPDGHSRLRQLIDQSISDDNLKDALGYLRTPRQLFKFLHRLIEEHCHRHTEDNPRWTIDQDTFRMVYNSHMRDLEAFDRGFGHG